MSINIAILGHSGMLGSAVRSWFSRKDYYYNLILPTVRFTADNSSQDALLEQIHSADYVINCAGAIPQSFTNPAKNFFDINFQLPDFLFSNFKTIHACTDCVYSGMPLNHPPYTLSSAYDASDDYGISKSRIYQLPSFLRNQSNIRIIRASIIGPDKYNKSLYSWLLSCLGSSSPINGYVNHFWNGITTLQWAIYSEHLIQNFSSTPTFTVPVSDRISKFQLLQYILSSFGYDPSIIVPVEHPITKDKSLLPTEPILYNPIDLQLKDLKDFFSL